MLCEYFLRSPDLYGTEWENDKLCYVSFDVNRIECRKLTFLHAPGSLVLKPMCFLVTCLK